MNKFKFTLLTEEGKVFEDYIDKAIVTTAEGEITVLKKHIPLISVTKAGRLIVYNNNVATTFQTKEGVLKISKDEVTLMSYKVMKI